MDIQKIKLAREITERRLKQFPNSPYFHFALKEMIRIEEQLAKTTIPDKAFYDSLSIGVMCVKELDDIDPEYCAVIFDSLSELRPKD